MTPIEETNNDFALILDSIIDFEKKCNYYTDSLFFDIRINEYPEKSDHLYIEIESGVDKTVIINLEPIAFFKRKGHSFFVYDTTPTILFPSTGDFISMPYKTERPYKEPDEEEYMLIINDDSFSNWTFFFRDGRFALLRSFSRCK